MENSISYDCKEGQFDVVEMTSSRLFSINLNAQHVNGMTPFDSYLSTIIRYSRVVSRKKKRSNFCT